MEALFSMFTEGITEIIVIVIGALFAVVVTKAKGYLEVLRKKDELGIIDLVTDRVVEYAEAELKGQAGIIKRDFAVKKAVAILASKGIKVNEEEVIAGIENGVAKIRMNNQFLSPFSADQVYQN